MKLAETTPGTPEEFNVVVEIPKGSPEKIEYDEAADKMVVDFVFRDGFRFIYNYGFIPQTHGGDGDTLDVIILGDKPLVPGSVVKARPLGIVKMLDRGEPDDKIIAILVGEPEQELDLAELRNFYAEVARQKNKVVDILGYEDKNRAMETIKKAQR